MYVLDVVTRSKHPIEVDLSVIEELADGDPAELADLIAMFTRHMGEGIERVRAAIASGEFTPAAQVVHTCIGFTATLGISALVPTLRRLERASQKRQTRLMARLLAQWEREFEQVLSIAAKR